MPTSRLTPEDRILRGPPETNPEGPYLGSLTNPTPLLKRLEKADRPQRANARSSYLFVGQSNASAGY